MYDPTKPHAGYHPRIFAIVAKGQRDARIMRAFWADIRAEHARRCSA